ncbi:PPE family protein [Mycobacterium asiaticum]|uniref:PPE family domain-containing protein n=1 Tax=Mycobacterium asiaticum TaxID=1790 RepID=A0A1A3MYS1_MYCAS|nr:PPE family protein [Mycobacterium asiaticum]OBK14230.1 hypothetical protein A5635_00600 [Mycobacterium asiaticum]
MWSFEMLPPELNSARMYSGAGSAPLFSAASFWDGLGADLRASASSFDSVISGLANGSWAGPAATAMAGIAGGYVAWLTASAGLAESSAVQARAAATAFEAARTATVHPAEVTANRTHLLTLVATNFLGLNAPAIAASEFEYIEMWAQDVAAMLTYHAGAIAVASMLIPFSTLPLDFAGIATQAVGWAESAGTAVAAAAPQVVSAVQSFPLDAVAQGVQMLSTPVSMALSPLSSAMGGGAQGSAELASVAAPAELPGAGASAALRPLGGAGLGASAGLGQARTIGGLSVPQSWTGSTPAALGNSALTGWGSVGLPTAAALAGGESAAAAGAGMPMMPMPTGAGAGQPPGRMMGGGGGSHVVQSRPSVIPRIGV